MLALLKAVCNPKGAFTYLEKEGKKVGYKHRSFGNGNGNGAIFPGTAGTRSYFLGTQERFLKILDRTGTLFENFQVSQKYRGTYDFRPFQAWNGRSWIAKYRIFF